METAFKLHIIRLKTRETLHNNLYVTSSIAKAAIRWKPGKGGWNGKEG